MSVPGDIGSRSLVDAHRDNAFVLEALLLWLLALSINLFNMNHPPRYDELYHVLAARSWSEDGTLAIGDGTYTRAALFSIITGWMFNALGPGLAVARIVPVLATSALVVSVFLWTRSNAGRTAAWIAALLICVSSETVELAQFIRFYSLHALLFFVGAVIVYRLVSTRHDTPAMKGQLALVAAVCFGIGIHLQMTTLVGALGLVVWAFVAFALQALSRPRQHRHTVLVIALIAATVVVVGVIGLYTGLLDKLWATFRAQALWAQGSTFLLYHGVLLKAYPSFYSMLPVVVCIALASRPKPALFCIIIFTVSVVVHSLGGMRGERYIFYVMPFFFALCAMALDASAAYLRQLSAHVYASLLPSEVGDRYLRRLQCSVIALSVLFLIATNSGFYKTFKVLYRGPGAIHPQHNVDWARARETLEPLLQESPVLVTTNGLSSLYYLGRLDIEYNASHLYETETGEEFAPDPRTGRPVISTAESLEKLMSCYKRGIVISEDWQWLNPLVGINAEAAELLKERARPVPLPNRAKLVAFQWDNPEGNALGLCPKVKRHGAVLNS